MLVPHEFTVDASPHIPTLLDRIIGHAAVLKSSDIHIDIGGEKALVRLRTSGRLTTLCNLEKNHAKALIARVKVMAQIKTDGERGALDGRFEVKVNDEPLDIRVSILRTLFGQNTVLRLLKRSVSEIGITSIGFLESGMQMVLDALHEPAGLMLIAGPTGSGKTTTLRALLEELRHRENIIVTIEDPVEYMIPEARHIEVGDRSGLTFGSALRAVLRQDPDIILVGEIRDKETAEHAINGALTGHLILSSIHAANVEEALQRLRDFGISSLHQSLVIKLLLSERLLLTKDGRTRAPVFEVYRTTKELRTLIAKNVTDTELSKYQYKGQRSRFEDQVKKYLDEDKVDYEEVQAVFGKDFAEKAKNQ